MNDVLAPLMVVALFGVCLGSIVWLARRAGRRGVTGGYSLMGPFDELWNPAGLRGRLEVVAQDERVAPSPSPGDRLI